MFLFHRHMQASRRRTYAPGTTLTSGRVATCPRGSTTCASSRRTSTSSSSTRHGCQMAIARFLESYVLGPSGFWTMALLRCAAKFDPFLKEGIKFCHLATMLQGALRGRRPVRGGGRLQAAPQVQPLRLVKQQGDPLLH